MFVFLFNFRNVFFLVMCLLLQPLLLQLLFIVKSQRKGDTVVRHSLSVKIVCSILFLFIYLFIYLFFHSFIFKNV